MHDKLAHASRANHWTPQEARSRRYQKGCAQPASHRSFPDLVRCARKKKLPRRTSVNRGTTRVLLLAMSRTGDSSPGQAIQVAASRLLQQSELKMNIPFDSTSLTAQSVFADATDSPGIRDFEFSLCLRGRGHTEDEAWQDATDAFHFDQYQADLPAEAERMKTATRQVLQLLRCYRGTPPQAAATPTTMREYEFTVDLIGSGATKEEGWGDACKGFSLEPGDPATIQELRHGADR
jgi:hypothetical protein